MWAIADIPPQSGRLAIVTGATGGLGYATAFALARAGAEVVIAARNPAKAATALAAIGSPNVTYAPLDLASLASVAAFAARVTRPLDLLVNNAGVMALPTRCTTEDGFELQFGTNYLGHFALAAHLLPHLRAAPHPRVVSLASLAHRRGRIDFEDLQGARNYRPWKAYSQSKLAMLLFARELQRRSDAADWGLASFAAHPGWARTDLVANGPASRGVAALVSQFAALAAPLFIQSAAAGALPILYAATSPDAQPGAYYGPDGAGEIRGHPSLSKLSPAAQDAATAAKLWAVSEQVTGVRFGT